MPYLAKSDYVTIQRKILEDLLMQGVAETDRTGDALLRELELHAESEIKSFLADTWEISTELAKNASDDPDIRVRIIMKCYIDLVLYHLHHLVAPSDVPENRMKAYEEARMCLDAIREETLNPEGLTRRTDADTLTKTKLVSNRKFIFHPHDDMSASSTQTEPVNPNP